jgi:type VI secretion system secreted protein Hcp
MAVDMFLKIDGVTGESVDSKHAKEIDVLSWSWGGSQSASGHIGGGSGAGKVSIQDLSITKYVDKSSGTLLQKMCKGDHLKSAVLVVRKAGTNPLEYIKLKMEEVLISSLSTGGSGGEDRLTEHLSLNFTKFEYEYVPQKADGSPDSSSPVKWNIAKNSES